MDLLTPVSDIFMVGPTYAKRLIKLNIFTVGDLLNHLPSRYDDFSIITNIGRVETGKIVTIQADVVEIKNEFTKNGRKIQKAKISDGTGVLGIIWFNQPFLVKTINIGERYNFSGKVEWFGRTLSMISPDYEQIKLSDDNRTQLSAPNLPFASRSTSPASPYSPRFGEAGASQGGPNTIHTGRLVPVYPETYGISSKWLRSRIAPLLNKSLFELKDYLPENLLDEYHLLDLLTALKWIHFPDNLKQAEEARHRLAFNEFLLIQLSSLTRKQNWIKKHTAPLLPINPAKKEEFVKNLPFKLTNAQQRSINEILNDMVKPVPMNRLLQGDVGSGKTVVAAAAIYTAYLNGYQTVLMVPTEILAEQHHQTLTRLLSPFGLKILLLTGSKKQFNNLPAGKAGLTIQEYDLIVGTQAILFNKTDLPKLGLIIIDEQHRFGVEQRGQLINKAITPHILTMTATPIPRTVALTIYGDLDLSIIDEMPIGRNKVKTWVVPPTKREGAYEWIKKHVKGTDEQAFIICPLIEEPASPDSPRSGEAGASQGGSETLQTAKAATVEFEKLQKNTFRDLKLGLLHGKMKSTDKNQVLDKFRDGSIDVLVSTPVVEVGIDIPKATIMMIEAADRFGLAQLHQLRGRVGRGIKESFCLLFTDITQGKTTERLKAMENIYSGMNLAEIDMKMRGPGDISGIAQHGFPDLKAATYNDLELINETKNAAEQILKNPDSCPVLLENINKFDKNLIKPT